MSYNWVMISELDGLSLGSGGEQIDKYLSQKNVTALLIGVQCLENGSTIPTAANIHTKIGTIEVVGSNLDGSGGSQVSIDVDDIPPLMEKLYGKAQPGIMGSQADNQFIHFQYFLPLSPDIYSSKFGYRDARIKIITSGTQTNSDTYKLYVAALLHNEKPSHYIQMLNNNFTATANVNKDLDLPEGGKLMGAYAMGTTSLNDLTTSDAPSINELAVVVDNTEKERVNTRALLGINPTGVYMVGGTTVTSTAAVGGSEYIFWDLGWLSSARNVNLSEGLNIGKNWKLRVKPQAADAIRVYPLIAMPAAGR